MVRLFRSPTRADRFLNTGICPEGNDVMKRALTGLFLENFRSIRGPVDLDLAPITLLYGPNSAGKTAIREALRLAGELCAGGGASGTDFVTSMHHHDYEKKMVIGVRFTEGWFQGFLDESTVGISRTSYEEMLPELFEYMTGDEICSATFEIMFEIDFNWSEHSTRGTRLHSFANKESITANGLPLIINDIGDERLMINVDHPLIQSINRHLGSTGETISTLTKAVFDADVININPLIFFRARNDFCDRRFSYEFNDENIFNVGMQESLKHRMLEAVIGSIYFVPLKIAERLLTELCHIGPLRHIPTEPPLTFLALLRLVWVTGSELLDQGRESLSLRSVER